MKRGEVWTVADSAADYAGKPRPVLILQDDAFPTDSVVVVPFTTDPVAAPLIRLPIAPDPATNGLSRPCSLMVEKVSAVRRAKIGRRIGALTEREMAVLGGMVATVLGLARGATASRTGTRV